MTIHCLYDLETTNLFENRSRPLSLQPELFEGYFLNIDGDTLDKIDDLHVFAKPKKPIAAGASKATGKKDKDFVDFEPFAANAEKVKATIEAADRMTAFNEGFDYTILSFEFARLGMTVKWPERFDLMTNVEHLFGFRPSLTILYEHLFGHKFEGAHIGRSDVIAMWQCYKKLMEEGEI